MIEEHKFSWPKLFWIPKTKYEKQGLLVVLLLVAAFIVFHTAERRLQATENEKLWSTLRSLTPSKVATVELLAMHAIDIHGQPKLVARIHSRVGIQRFITRMGDLSKWMPNHPLDHDRYLVKIHLSSGEVITMDLERPFDRERIYHIYVHSNMKGYLTLQGRGLVAWVSNRVPE